MSNPDKKSSEASAAKTPEAAAAQSTPVHHEVLAFQQSDVLTALLLLRWCSALCVRTFFQPDEYFQSLEPAWALVHGPAGGAWLTWEWRYHLRTSLHPVLFAGVYLVAETLIQLVHAVGPLRAILLTAAPGAAQAVFAAITDYYVWRLAGQLYGFAHNATWAALWLCVVSPWEWYCGPRTFSNGLEATLTAAALSYWPWQIFDGDGTSSKSIEGLLAKGALWQLRLSLVLAATAVVLRPTNLLIWAALLTVAATRMTLDVRPAASAQGPRPSVALLLRLAGEIAGCGLLVLAVSAVSDRLYYGVWTLPAYTFLDINLKQDVAVFYGRNDWHYYLSQGLPLLTMTSLPFALVGVYAALITPGPAAAAPAAALRTSNARKAIAFAVVGMVAALSLVSHKEVRFLYPLLPMLQVLAAPHAASFFTTASAAGTSPSPSAVPRKNDPSTSLRHTGLLAAAVAVNAVVAGYLSLGHQPAPLSVLGFLRGEYERIHFDWVEVPAAELPAYDTYPDPSWSTSAASSVSGASSDGDGDELFALFLVPCHSTPWRSHLVYPGLRVRALTCEPPLDTPPRSAARAAYLDEADRFYAAPAHFLAAEIWPPRADTTDSGRQRGGEIPRYIVGFEGLEDTLAAFFASADGAGLDVTLRRAWTGWNGFFNEDGRRRGALVVWDTGVYSNASHPEAT